MPSVLDEEESLAGADREAQSIYQRGAKKMSRDVQNAME